MKKDKNTRRLAAFLAAVITATTILPGIGQTVTAADYGDTDAANSDTWHYYCIDNHSMTSNGKQVKGDVYQCVRPEEALSASEIPYAFWGMWSLKAGFETMPSVTNPYHWTSEQAVNAGLKPLYPFMTESDLGKILHDSGTRAKYDWLDYVVAHADEYLRLGGLIGGASGSGGSGDAGGSSGSGSGGGGGTKTAPAVLQGHSSQSAPLQIDAATKCISFDAGGADRDFIRTVPLRYWNGTGYVDQAPDGWICTKTDTQIQFYNANPAAPPLSVMFDTAGTEYGQGAGGYSSAEELYSNTLQVWKCVECSGKHTSGSKYYPTQEHQRLVEIELAASPALGYYAVLGTVLGGEEERPGSGHVNFKVYRHEEDMMTNYNLQMYKYDHETGMPLEDSIFRLYERFDDKGEVDREKDGPVHLYEGGEPYRSQYLDNPVVWDDFRFVTSLKTDGNGHADYTVNHKYHYDKTFCDGHPAPAFVSVPEEEEDPETGEVENEAEIQAAQSENMQLAETWQSCFAACADKAQGDFEGVHFHWLMDAVSESEIGSIAGHGGSPGETPSAGPTASAGGEESYGNSGCREDCEATYEKFIAMQYSYALKEDTAREGYIQHDTHPDDLPIEIITTDASEHGANASFAGEYSVDMTVSRNAAIGPLMVTDGAVRLRAYEGGNDEANRTGAAADDAGAWDAVKPEKGETEGLLQRIQRIGEYVQEVLSFFTGEPVGESKKATASNAGAAVGAASASNAGSVRDAGTGTNPGAATKSDTDTIWSETGTEDGQDEEDAEENSRDMDLVDNVATASDAMEPRGIVAFRRSFDGDADPSDRGHRASSADAAGMADAANTAATMGLEDTAGNSPLFSGAYQQALGDASSGAELTPGPDDHYSHCDDADGEGDAWRIYDHRTEGEVHINKRDLELQAGEADGGTDGDAESGYDSYGDTQGDGTLEGAVYGLFAAADIFHPDGKTGVVYRKDNLVAVAASDKEGDASFVAHTEAPGYDYDYEQGKITKTGDGWADRAPDNLYTADRTCDDYTADGRYERQYYDNEGKNGNGWIGRPLLLGDYYIRELTRSEGYELWTSIRPDDATKPGAYALISRNLYPEEQIKGNPDGSYGNADVDELFFFAKSKETGAEGFDVILNHLPPGTRAYRLESGTKTVTIETPTGEYEKVYLTNEDGSPKVVVAERDYQYPRFNEDGSLMTVETPVSYVANGFRSAAEMPLDAARVQEAMESAEPELDADGVAARLAAEYTGSEEDVQFVKVKVEKALRACGRKSPRRTADGIVYSTMTQGIFDTGVWEGEPDGEGLSGVQPGEAAARTVCGAPVQTIAVSKTGAEGEPIKLGDAILTLLDFYNTNAWYSYGGLDAAEEDESRYRFTVYTGVVGNPETYMVFGGWDGDGQNGDGQNGDGQDGNGQPAGILYRRVPYLPADRAQRPRYLYAAYSAASSGQEEDGIFGTYVNYQEQPIGGLYFANATLVPDAVADGDGTLVTKTISENVYYQTGETVHDAQGNPMQACEYRPITTTSTREILDCRWVEASVETKAGKQYAHFAGSYRDSYGAVISDEDGEILTHELRLVLPQKTEILSQEEVEDLGADSGWSAGEAMGSGAYYQLVKGAYAKAVLNFAGQNAAGQGSTGQGDTGQGGTGQGIAGENHYAETVSLVYPGQDFVWQDGEGRPGTNTRNTPVGVLERAIKQSMKIVKSIEGMKGTEKMDNFRFKAYLKSNLERLYRDESGQVVWLDKKGNPIDVAVAGAAFPERVRKIFTKVLHRRDPLYRDSREAAEANLALYGYTAGLIHEKQNPGYTAVLETVERLAEDGAGTRVVTAYNYDKFFDAVAVANHDKWEDAAPTYTSWQPIGNEPNRTEDTLENTKSSDKVRQFAIDWYLEDEVKKLVREVPGDVGETEEKEGSVPYTDELYDRALRCAIIKSENYLKPFFAYDLDSIYEIAWDSDEDGGTDRDEATLSADTEAEESYYGISEALPYGTYVVVEQQPRYAALEDFPNRHYQIDRPREVTLPAAYESYGGSQASPEVYNGYYDYDPDLPVEEMERRYRIRFQEESDVIYAHNHSGDFQVYKYGLDIGCITNGVPAAVGAGDYYALTQAPYKPDKNYYNDMDIRSEAGNAYYLAEGGSGRTGVSACYRYSSVSEHAGEADAVPYPGGPATEDNVPGIWYRDHVKTMQGMQTAYADRYAAMLVPKSITEPKHADTEAAETEPGVSGESSYVGYGYTKFRNRPYQTKLRIEKLDSETHENILHDGAMFNIYVAKRDERKDGDGSVLFYEKDTTITGSREFLEAMGAVHIQPYARQAGGPGTRYSGIVPAGTPICAEQDQIIQQGAGEDTATAAFKTYTTVLDGAMKDEATNQTLKRQKQTVGYLETPQPLGAGTYVLCERKAPAGYVRSKPVALEIYSDKVAYYKEGDRDSRVLAAIYEYEADRTTTNGNKPQDVVSVARVNMENTPIRLTVEKCKESAGDRANTTKDKTVTYKVSGRIDGKLADIGNHPDYVYAYEQGEYLGYGWKKGTLEYLKARQAAGEQVELVYEGSTFAGYAYVTRPLATADDDNPYVAGAVMTLFDAVALKSSGDTEDHAWEGLVVERNHTNNVTRMYVKEGLAGAKTEYVREAGEDGDAGETWSAKTVQRGDTDILYYDLDSLSVTVTESVDGRNILYGYDRNRNKVPIRQLESDKANYVRTDTEHSLFAFKGGTPYLELVGGDFTKLRYSPRDKVLSVGDGTLVYHLDRDGHRDALVDPYTGMAYVAGVECVLVWPVNIRRDEFGNVIARDKITTSRIATVGEGEGVESGGSAENGGPADAGGQVNAGERGYITGSRKSDDGEESHRETSVNTNKNGQNQNDEVLTDDNNGIFEKHMNPVYDRYGLARYYQRSEELYDKSTDLYDRNGDFVRQQDSDNLEAYNNAAYAINRHEALYDGDETVEGENRKKLYHRLGESYILENTWTTSEKTPNDPFDGPTTSPEIERTAAAGEPLVGETLAELTDGQPDVLKRLPAGCYIMEELKAPDGFLKGMPTGVTVQAVPGEQGVTMVDKTIKVLIEKVDGFEVGRFEAGTQSVNGRPVGAYGFDMLPGAELALYEAQKVYTADTSSYPKGYYLKQTGTTPVTFPSTDSTAGNRKEVTARWTTGTEAIYLEGIPAGDYLLKELGTPAGFVTARPLEVEIKESPEVQRFTMYDDHTRIEIEKYYREGMQQKPLGGAAFTLYEAQTDANGQVIYQDGRPQYHADRPVDHWVSSDGKAYRAFIPAFEEMYRMYGTTPGTSVGWSVDGTEHRATYVSSEQTDASAGGGRESIFPTRATMRFRTEEGADIRIVVYGEKDNLNGRDFTFEYQFEYKPLPEINAYANAYTTADGRRHMEYLPAGASYVLVETGVPEGFAKAEDVVIAVKNTEEVQHYQVENTEGTIRISKVAEGRSGELAGAHLGLYRPDANGELVQSPEYLLLDWITGEDGVYTELDFINNRIPEGYEKGDLKPHSIRRLPDGCYWLAELESPAYYTSFAPVRIEYRQEEEIRMVRVSDRPVTGELEIVKTDRGGALLAGATFELTAFRQSDLRTPVDTRILKEPTDAPGKIHVTGLPVGEMQEDGQIVPYWYKLRELTPPDGYAAGTELYKWQFAPNHTGVSYGFGDTAHHTVTVVNEKTRIAIGKKDFDALGMDAGAGAWVEGAQLALYEITGRDEEDNLIYEEEHPCAVWTTTREEKAHVIEGLIAGRSYLLKELKAPPGYHRMEPVILTLSVDGRKIAEISNRLNTVTVHSVTPVSEKLDTDNLDLDSIRALTVKGRYGLRTVHEETPVGDKTVKITEKTRYSDGTERVSGHWYQAKESPGLQPELQTEGTAKMQPERRTVESVELSLEHADGTTIAGFRPMEGRTEETIANNVAPENPVIRMRNRGGRAGDALDPNQTVFNTVTYENTSSLATDMTLTVRLDPDTILLEEGSGTWDGSSLTFALGRVKPRESGYVSFVTEVQGASSAVTARLAYNGTAVTTTKEVPVLVPGRLTVFYELTGSGKELYKEETGRYIVRLYTEKGEELKGRYAYTGSRQGTLRSGDTIALKGNQFITIDPAPYRRVRYQVTHVEDGTELEHWNVGAVDAAHGACAVYTRSLPDTSRREHFQKGERYVLREFTRYSDGSVIESSRMAFTLNEQASVSEVGVADRKTEVWLSKIAITGEEELPGCHMTLLDEAGNVVDAWISGTEPHRLSGVLEPGLSYVLREERPADGYAYATDIEFTVNEDGSVDSVVMEDEQTRVRVEKIDAETGKPLAGAEFEILDARGNVCAAWTSREAPYEVHEISGVLTAGDTYVLREKKAPAGYEPMKDRTFTVPEGAEVRKLVCENHPKPPSPDGPDEPKPEPPVQPPVRKIGTITAAYTPQSWKAGGWLVFDEEGNLRLRLPGTGDRAHRNMLLAICLFSLGMIAVLKRKRR